MKAKINFPSEYAHDFTRYGGVCVAEIAPNGDMYVIARFLYRSDAMAMLRCIYYEKKLLVVWDETNIPLKDKILAKIKN